MAAYIARYQGNHKFKKKRDHVLTLYHRLTGHVDALITQGIVDDRTARVFLSTLTSLAYIGDYQAVIRNPADITPEMLRAKNRTYVGVVRDMWACFADDRKQGLGDFVHFNAFTRYAGGRERISYNQLIAAVSELAFELAYQDAQTRRMANAAPEHLKERAGIYFERLIRLAEINPDTMMPIAQGGTWPAW